MPARVAAAAEGDVDALARGAVFERVLHQIILERADQFVAVAQHDQRLARRAELDLDGAVARQHLQAVGHLAHDRRQIDRRGVRLQRAPDLATCDTTPGSFYAPAPSDTGPDTIYVHASDSSDIPTNGKLYELARRRWALQLYQQSNQASVYSVHTRRNAHADGSLVVDGFVSDCLAEDGRVHNAFIRGIAEDTTAWKIEPPTQYGGASMFVTYEDKADQPGVTYRRCQAIADADAVGPSGGTNGGLTLGFYGHATADTKFGTALYEGCEATGTAQGFGFSQVDAAVYYECRTDQTRQAIGANPTDTLAVLGGTYRVQSPSNAAFLRIPTDNGVPKKIIARGVRVITEGDHNMPIWIDRADGNIEISRSTFVQNGGGNYWLLHGSFDVENNIFYGENHALRIASSDVTYIGDHNLFFETTSSPAAFEIDTTDTSGLPAWRAATNQDLHSLDADPLFVGSPLDGDFRGGPELSGRNARRGCRLRGRG